MRSPKTIPILETCITPVAVLCLELADHKLISDEAIYSYVISGSDYRLISDETIYSYAISGSDYRLTSEKTRAASPPQTQSRI